MTGDEVALETVDLTGDRARALLRASMVEIASRYYRRPATPVEVDAALAAAPVDDLVLPGGLLVVATGADGTTLGCAGLRLLPEGVGEVVKVYVCPGGRGRGLGRRLVEEVERHAAAHDRTTARTPAPTWSRPAGSTPAWATSRSPPSTPAPTPTTGWPRTYHHAQNDPTPMRSNHERDDPAPCHRRGRAGDRGPADR